MTQEFVDLYEILEVSRNANMETIERVFRYKAQKSHPDINAENDSQFKQLVQAFETLRDPAKRAAYDAEWDKDRTISKELVQGANAASSDVQDRERILSVYYAQRRRDMNNPGVSIGKVAELTNCEEKVLEFHFWYLRTKGWIERLESGLLAITCEGVDRIESVHRSREPEATLLIEHQPNALEADVEKIEPVTPEQQNSEKPASDSATPELDPAEELRRKMMALNAASN